MAVANPLSPEMDGVFQMCEKGDLASLQRVPLEELRVVVNVPNLMGETPLFVAASNGHLSVCEFLVTRAGAAIDCIKGVSVSGDRTNNDGGTPLLVAVRQGSIELVRFFLAHGASPNHRKTGGATPTFIATQQGFLDILRTLVFEGHADASISVDDKCSCVYIAAQNNRADCLRFLLDECGQSPTDSDIHGWAPIHIAAQEGYVDITRILLDHGCNPLESVPSLNWSALGIAARNDRIDILKLFMKTHNCSVTDPSANDGWGILHTAAGAGAMSVLMHLLSNVADPNLRMSGDWTPLHIGVRSLHIKSCHALLAYGADLHAIACTGESVVQCCSVWPAMQAWLEVVRGWSQLQFAAHARLHERIRVLLQEHDVNPRHGMPPPLWLARNAVVHESIPEVSVCPITEQLLARACAPWSPTTANYFGRAHRVRVMTIMCMIQRICSADSDQRDHHASSFAVPPEIWWAIIEFTRPGPRRAAEADN